MAEPPFDFASLIRRGVKFRRCDAGERIFLEHDPGDCLYVVHTGRVDVITFGNVLESVGPNGIFGEMAMIDDGPRSAAALDQRADRARHRRQEHVPDTRARGAGIRAVRHARARATHPPHGRRALKEARASWRRESLSRATRSRVTRRLPT